MDTQDDGFEDVSENLYRSLVRDLLYHVIIGPNIFFVVKIHVTRHIHFRARGNDKVHSRHIGL